MVFILPKRQSQCQSSQHRHPDTHQLFDSLRETSGKGSISHLGKGKTIDSKVPAGKENMLLPRRVHRSKDNNLFSTTKSVLFFEKLPLPHLPRHLLHLPVCPFAFAASRIALLKNHVTPPLFHIPFSYHKQPCAKSDISDASCRFSRPPPPCVVP